MRITVSTLSFAQLLCSAIAQEWTVSAYTGLQCNGEQLSHHEPSQQPAEDRECRLFGDFVATSSVVFAISEDTDDTWVFGLHESPEDNSCIYDPEGAGAYTRTSAIKQFTDCQHGLTVHQQFSLATTTFAFNSKRVNPPSTFRN